MPSAPPSRSSSQVRSQPYPSASPSGSKAGPRSSPAGGRVLQPISTRSPLPLFFPSSGGPTSTPAASMDKGKGKRRASELNEENEVEDEIVEDEDEQGVKAKDERGELTPTTAPAALPPPTGTAVKDDDVEEDDDEEVQFIKMEENEVQCIEPPRLAGVGRGSRPPGQPGQGDDHLAGPGPSTITQHQQLPSSHAHVPLSVPVSDPAPPQLQASSSSAFALPNQVALTSASASDSPPPAYSVVGPLLPPHPHQPPAGPSYAGADGQVVFVPALPAEEEEVEEVVHLSDEQQAVLDLVLGGKSLFFTGSAGTGKSFLLGHLIRRLKKAKKADGRPKVIGVTASTGIAGLNIKGQTLHSWSGVGLGLEDAEMLAEKVMGIFSTKDKRKMTKPGHKPALERWLTTDVLIVDEISMIDGRFFDKLEYVGRRTRQNDLPFGGIQLVLVGDFFQLPPVPNKGIMNFAFEARSWKECVPRMVHLSKVFRQKDDNFVRILNQMRLGCLDKTSNRILSGLKRPIHYEDDIYSELYPVKAQVDSANLARLKALTGQPYQYRAQDSPGYDEHDRRISDERCKSMLDAGRAPAEITLKVGAVVMLVVNLKTGSLCNGSLGKVVGFETRFEASRDDIDIAEVQAAGSDSDSDSSDTEQTLSGPRPLKRQKTTAPNPSAGSPSPPGPSTQIFQSSMTRPSPWDHRPSTTPATDPRNDGIPWPVVQFVTGERVLMIPHEFEEQIFARGRIRVLATRSAVPLILAWALSVHKSQGQTLTRVKIDLQRTFEKGQAYVAVSRCTSLDTLQIVNFLPSKVTAHPSVLAWARREGILDLDPDLLDKNQWLNKEVDLGGGMGKGMVIRIGGR